MPELIVVPPVYVLAPPSVRKPVPSFIIFPEPLPIMPFMTTLPAPPTVRQFAPFATLPPIATTSLSEFMRMAPVSVTGPYWR